MRSMCFCFFLLTCVCVAHIQTRMSMFDDVVSHRQSRMSMLDDAVCNCHTASAAHQHAFTSLLLVTKIKAKFHDAVAFCAKYDAPIFLPSSSDENHVASEYIKECLSSCVGSVEAGEVWLRVVKGLHARAYIQYHPNIVLELRFTNWMIEPDLSRNNQYVGRAFMHLPSGYWKESFNSDDLKGVVCQVNRHASNNGSRTPPSTLMPPTVFMSTGTTVIEDKQDDKDDGVSHENTGHRTWLYVIFTALVVLVVIICVCLAAKYYWDHRMA